MDGLVVSVGNGVASLMTGVYTAVGNALRGIVNAGNHALPYGLFWVLIVVLLVVGAWTLAKR